MENRIQEVKINEDLSITQEIQPGKVLLLVLDGVKGKASVCQAVEHGQTIVETAKSKAVKIKFHEDQLL